MCVCVCLCVRVSVCINKITYKPPPPFPTDPPPPKKKTNTQAAHQEALDTALKHERELQALPGLRRQVEALKAHATETELELRWVVRDLVCVCVCIFVYRH